jgi:polyisoprenoid-binding protein YceI
VENKIFKIVFFVIISFLSVLYPQELTVSSRQSNSIKFLAKSTLSNFEGTTSAVEGFIKWDSTSTNNNKVELKIYLDSLDTGIGLRNDHMREKYLETNLYPFAQFTGRITTQIQQSKLDSVVKAEGILRIHGIEKKQKITGRVSNYDKKYKLETSFHISLSEFNIEQPSFLFISVDNDIVVECTIYLIK